MWGKQSRPPLACPWTPQASAHPYTQHPHVTPRRFMRLLRKQRGVLVEVREESARLETMHMHQDMNRVTQPA